MNFKNIHMLAVLTASLMVSSVLGYMLVQEVQAEVSANGGNANGGNANGGNGALGAKGTDAVSGTDAGTGGNGAAAGPGGIAVCVTETIPC